MDISCMEKEEEEALRDVKRVVERRAGDIDSVKNSGQPRRVTRRAARRTRYSEVAPERLVR